MRIEDEEYWESVKEADRSLRALFLECPAAVATRHGDLVRASWVKLRELSRREPGLDTVGPKD